MVRVTARIMELAYGWSSECTDLLPNEVKRALTRYQQVRTCNEWLRFTTYSSPRNSSSLITNEQSCRHFLTFLFFVVHRLSFDLAFTRLSLALFAYISSHSIHHILWNGNFIGITATLKTKATSQIEKGLFELPKTESQSKPTYITLLSFSVIPKLKTYLCLLVYRRKTKMLGLRTPRCGLHVPGYVNSCTICSSHAYATTTNLHRDVIKHVSIPIYYIDFKINAIVNYQLD